MPTSRQERCRQIFFFIIDIITDSCNNSENTKLTMSKTKCCTNFPVILFLTIHKIWNLDVVQDIPTHTQDFD